MKALRRLLLMVGVVLCLAVCCGAEAGWTKESWAAVQAELYSDTPEPVPPSLRLTASPGAFPFQDWEDRELTVLLMGTDAPDMNRNFGRTDLMLLCHMNFETGDIRLLSLPEEALVSLPGLPGNIMLRHVNCFGGPEVLMETVNRLLDAGARRYCAVNFDTFERIVDTMNGVTLRLTEGEALALGLSEGEARLTGADALRYVRLRRQGDGSVRARKLMEAIVQRFAVHGSLLDAYRMLDLLLPLVDTDLTTKNLMDMAFSVVGREDAGAFAAQGLALGEDGTLDETARLACRAFLYPEGPKK